MFVITDASGTFNELTRDAAWDRMSGAGAQLMTWFGEAVARNNLGYLASHHGGSVSLGADFCATSLAEYMGYSPRYCRGQRGRTGGLCGDASCGTPSRLMDVSLISIKL